MPFFNLYQYLAPLLLFPLSYFLWLRQYESNHAFVLLALSIPVSFAYVIPGLGTNWLRLWEFNTRFRLGKFRPQHGFVFGAATSLMALVCLGGQSTPFSLVELFRAGFILGSVLAFWNWWYDMLAIKAGYIIVYNRPFANKQGAETIAADYAPVLFGGFGFCYGLILRLCQYYLLELGRWDYYWAILGLGNVLGVIIPVVAFVAISYLRSGESGLNSYALRRDA